MIKYVLGKGVNEREVFFILKRVDIPNAAMVVLLPVDGPKGWRLESHHLADLPGHMQGKYKGWAVNSDNIQNFTVVASAPLANIYE